LAALGFNALLQTKLDAAVKADKDALQDYIKVTQSKTDTILALEVIYFHLSSRLASAGDLQ